MGHAEGQSKSRFLNRDGRFNVVRVGLPKNAFGDLYHFLLSITWPQFIFVMILGYFLVNLTFGFVYYLAGPGAVEGVRAHEGWPFFWECFFFSVQTLATIGYGKINPSSVGTNLVVTIEAFLGMTAVALSTGLAFARFSKPTAKVLFSKSAVISKMDGELCFVFRMANSRKNQIVEANVRVTLVRTETTQEGESFRNLYDLELERTVSPLFALTWTVVHPIRANSPLFGKTAVELESTSTEIMISMAGTDGTMSQTIHARHSYSVEDMLWNHRFEDMFTWDEKGTLYVDLKKIDSVAPIQTA